MRECSTGAHLFWNGPCGNGTIKHGTFRACTFFTWRAMRNINYPLCLPVGSNLEQVCMLLVLGNSWWSFFTAFPWTVGYLIVGFKPGMQWMPSGILDGHISEPWIMACRSSSSSVTQVQDCIIFFACICDKGIGRESQTEKISDEKKMQKEKRPDECWERDFKVNSDFTVQKSSRGCPSFGLVGMQASQQNPTLHCLMDKTDPEKRTNAAIWQVIWDVTRGIYDHSYLLEWGWSQRTCPNSFQ